MRIVYFLMMLLMPYIAWADGPVLPAKEKLVAVDVNQMLDKVTIDPFQDRIPNDVPVVPPQPVIVPPAVIATPQFQQAQPTMPMIVDNPLASIPTQKPNFIVEGIIWSDTIHEAVVSGQLITVGDRIADAVVVDINRDGVIVDVRGTKFTVGVQ